MFGGKSEETIDAYVHCDSLKRSEDGGVAS